MYSTSTRTTETFSRANLVATGKLVITFSFSSIRELKVSEAICQVLGIRFLAENPEQKAEISTLTV